MKCYICEQLVRETTGCDCCDRECCNNCITVHVDKASVCNICKSGESEICLVDIEEAFFGTRHVEELPEVIRDPALDPRIGKPARTKEGVGVVSAIARYKDGFEYFSVKIGDINEGGLEAHEITFLEEGEPS